ncbi:hypothetical protein HFP89_04120 [Wenzhouxiangella sp. XN79A]|uniref:zinc ribbon domain-containing protein n=1 Tax=Wenzhouxiangella sp. XN79A TaxID=2724193 RepID=UPI00144AEF76|nr:zinc ribbon domain-containing protein [Wenzhouxiangella sp. XN79A]NKI34345.1 hypothetical protein [Wenzhouxiangella sp. XN79A]
MTEWKSGTGAISNLDLKTMPLSDLQRFRSKRWRERDGDLKERVEAELKRRDPRNDWQCRRCEHRIFHEKQIRASGSAAWAWLGVETEKFHAVVCNYCGHTEFYSVLMDNSSKAIDFLIGT